MGRCQAKIPPLPPGHPTSSPFKQSKPPGRTVRPMMTGQFRSGGLRSADALVAPLVRWSKKMNGVVRGAATCPLPVLKQIRATVAFAEPAINMEISTDPAPLLAQSGRGRDEHRGWGTVCQFPSPSDLRRRPTQPDSGSTGFSRSGAG